MKKRLILSILFILLAFLAWWFWPRGQVLPGVNGQLAVGHASVQPSTSQGAGNVKAPTPHTNGAGAPAPLTPAQFQAYEQSEMPHMLDLMAKANRPIQFYGKVIDQNNNPIPDVKVNLSIKLIKAPRPGMFPGDMFDDYTLTTDTDGFFSLTDAKGELLTMRSLEKPGYEMSQQTVNKGYWYWASPGAEYVPDPNKPEIFEMWKEAGAEQLVRNSISFGLSYNGTPAGFDLMTGSQANPGDLRVTLLRDPQQLAFGQRNYEWTATIEIPDGGLIASNDDQMYLAPAGGYQSQLVIQMPPNTPGWTDHKDVALYLKLRGGKYYGRANLKFIVGAHRANTPFYIISYINPSGSRNLEPPPAPPPPPPLTNPVQQPIIYNGSIGP